MNLRTKKIIPYFLALILLVGFFSFIPTKQAHAQAATGTCSDSTKTTQATCVAPATWTPATSTDNSSFVNQINADQCFSVKGVVPNISVPGCVKQFFYYAQYMPSAIILMIAATFFNAIIAIALSSTLIASSTFIPAAWAVVRDLSNLFFILILLYISIRLILGLGGHDVKQMIGKVVIIALLINFSMFFTQVVIDSSNILALIFYSKINVNTNVNGQPRPYQPSTGAAEKDISGAMYSSFDPTTRLDANFWTETEQNTDPITGVAAAPSPTVPVGIMVGVILIAVSIMIFAAWAFFWAGLAFLSRMIELWLLIIFSPFAFMSSTVPFLSSIEYIGWGAWFKRLLKVSFMAPIFMFFMYLIFLLLGANLFGGMVTSTNGGMVQSLLAILIPALCICILLVKATDFAKKGSGILGEKLMQGAKIVGGLALGAATGGASMLGSGVIGGIASQAAGNENLKEAAKEKGIKGFSARMALKTADYGSKASFDLRKAPGIGSLAKSAGLNLNSSSAIGLGPKEGGYKGRVERQEKKLKEESELQKTGKTDTQVKEWSKVEGYKYDAKMNEARNKEGDKFNEDEFKKKNGERPAEYATADALNTSRMKAYQSNLGQSGLLGTMAYEAVKRGFLENGLQNRGKKEDAFVDAKEKIKDKDGNEIDNPNYYKNSEEYKKSQKRREDAIKEASEKQGTFFNQTAFEEAYDTKNKPLNADAINKQRVQQAKMVIGGAASVIPGVLTGGVLGVGMAGVGAVGAGGYAMTESAAEKKFSASLEKEFKKMGDIESRITEMKKLLETQTDVLKTGVDLGIATAKKDASGKEEKDSYGNVVYAVDSNKLTEELAKTSVAEQDMKSQLEAINRRINTEGGKNSSLDRDMQVKKDELLQKMFEHTMKAGKLSALKGIDKEMANTRNQIYNFNGQKATLKEASHASAAPKAPAAAHAPAAPVAHAPAPAAHAEPAHEAPAAHAPAADHGGDHGGGGGGHGH
jgi:hypothetical protein